MNNILSITIVQPYHFEKYVLNKTPFFNIQGYSEPASNSKKVSCISWVERFYEDVEGNFKIDFDDGTCKEIAVNTNGLQVESEKKNR